MHHASGTRLLACQRPRRRTRVRAQSCPAFTSTDAHRRGAVYVSRTRNTTTARCAHDATELSSSIWVTCTLILRTSLADTFQIPSIIASHTSPSWMAHHHSHIPALIMVCAVLHASCLPRWRTNEGSVAECTVMRDSCS